ncbi:MAG: hypothetical protein Q4F29_04075 [Lachnospiraceae bacterium]|nr:hypothetical protein [Lachnospiraceae bacterium]
MPKDTGDFFKAAFRNTKGLLEEAAPKFSRSTAAAARMVSPGRGGMESFAMTGSQPFASQNQTLHSPDTIVVEDEEKKQENAADPNLPQVLSTAETAAFGEVNTPVTDASSRFGAGR